MDCAAASPSSSDGLRRGKPEGRKKPLAFNLDEPVKSQLSHFSVIPAKAGIQ
jgi:hypothetical protein